MSVTPEQVRKLLDAATPGPWTADEIDPRSPYGEWYACEINGPVDRTSMGGRGTVVVAMHVGKPERELIAATPEIAAAYLELNAKLEHVDYCLDKWRHGASAALAEYAAARMEELDS